MWVGRVFGPTGQENLAQGLPWETCSNVSSPHKALLPLRPREKHPARRVGGAEGAPKNAVQPFQFAPQSRDNVRASMFALRRRAVTPFTNVIRPIAVFAPWACGRWSGRNLGSGIYCPDERIWLSVENLTRHHPSQPGVRWTIGETQ
jgi:hypothetical protein